MSVKAASEDLASYWKQQIEAWQSSESVQPSIADILRLSERCLSGTREACAASLASAQNVEKRREPA